MSISVIVATYGDRKWMTIGRDRATSSVVGRQADCEVVINHQDDGTIASTRNEGAERSESDWLCFLDADDELAPGYIGAMTAAIRNETARWRDWDMDAPMPLLTPAVQIVRKGRAGQPTFFKEVPLRQANWIVVGTLIHRDLFWEVGGFDNHPHGLEDWALWSKCVRVGAEIVKVPDAVYRYWANPDSMHRQLWREKGKQIAEHRRVAAELDAWEAARA